MKSRLAVFFRVFVPSLIAIFAIQSFVRSSSYCSTTITTAFANSDTSPSAQPGKPTTTATNTENSDDSWKESATDVAHDAEVAAKKAYNHLVHAVKDMSLEGRTKAVLYENKSTRDSDVHVAADNGTVTITGRVPSERAAKTVQEVVAGVYGVEAVNNELSHPHPKGAVTPPDADSMAVAHPAYSDTAPAENAAIHYSYLGGASVR